MSDWLWTHDEAEKATGGTSTAPWNARGVAFDSRAVVDDDLFVALRGETSDGHAYVMQAFRNGAAAALVERAPEVAEGSGPLLVVVDTGEGLDRLARAARARTGARIAAVTGSVGKTGTKDALRHVLSRQGTTHASEKSFNNHVGTPLSLARMPRGAAWGIFEIGTNAPGEIAPLSALVRPHVALVTNVESVHSGNFAGETAIAAEKAAIFDALEPGGVAVINADNRHAGALTAHATTVGAGRVVRFGMAQDADVRLLSLRADGAGSLVEASVEGRKVSYRLALAGRHQALNSLGVLAVVHHLGADVAAAAAALGDIVPLAGRGVRHEIAVAGGAALLIDESYNASPVALRAALEVLAETLVGKGGRRIAVLGDMLELGDTAVAQHIAMAADVERRKIDLVFAVGPLMNRLYGQLPTARRGGAAGDARSIAALLSSVVRPGDVVLVKGSRRIGLEAVVEALAAAQVPVHADASA
ncbi:MAG: UDP-N-acetylmuramoyl-tripeptide--D-alanyl-D-alanine ligase [Proteobacteria bacterium]|nr:UDP-N-acetylmuramoyl-tripeptide--D-alanyl-D-alanine ligase [Pseudomonadota bacterium]